MITKQRIKMILKVIVSTFMTFWTIGVIWKFVISISGVKLNQFGLSFAIPIFICMLVLGNGGSLLIYFILKKIMKLEKYKS